MDLSEDEIDLIRGSFRELALGTPATAGLFYDRLFELAPEMKRLFPADMEQQGTKMMSMLGAIVARIHDHAALVPLVTDLARRHVGYGALPVHYDLVGEALLWTLDQRLGEGFTPAIREAWVKAYTALAGVMVAIGAEGGPTAPG
jgi:nitric oxide dioxygenase